ncbi:hypothetical protein D9Q98_009254 [Chlorella vulgaris]|uniref:Uncharacterized protein n=1 Tax=Chlorella vulgaris TaxID=3077 RepID=A0A9D4YX67_CHLVU|nr:hypothetical protein D9Q98_009254 [Chlorella vulgaris]
MLRVSLALALLALCGSAAATTYTQTYSTIQPATYTVSLGFNISGTVAPDPTPCTAFNTATSTCLPQVSVPDKDSVIITYSGPVTEGNTISIMTCFSNSSSMDRAWRKANAIIGNDKQCNVEKPMVKGLPTGEGTYTWTPGPNTPQSSYSIQVLEVVAGSNPTTYAAMGRSTGFFQIIPIDSRPSWLLGVVGGMCAVGPITLAGFFVWEKMLKKEA